MKQCTWDGCTKPCAGTASHSRYCEEHRQAARQRSQEDYYIRRRNKSQEQMRELRENILCYVGDIPVFKPPESMHSITERIRQNGGSYYPRTYKPDPPIPRVHVMIGG